ncbi:biotin synthase BioB [Desulfovibrio sp. TomC]|uniref:biotin synthase BioB n=1 Tax=Desulfovibrio sp. TomC TaxID=1562888 RepID=UPI0005734786|nr:biotin synthase BioB [Desulfovibrio sp. TomC]KHK03363.1 Biotin synthase [Desulfovibrio sp. TomC]
MPLFSAFADAIVRPLLAGGLLSDTDRDRLLDELPRATGPALDALARAADAVRRVRVGNTVSLCAIISAKSGRCGEDCAFCAQSGHHRTAAPEHAFLAPPEITAAAAAMHAAGVARFGIVASGKALPEAELARAADVVAAIAATGMAADASFGVLSRDALVRLKAAGLAAYHHNLETSRAFYPHICTTRTFTDNLDVLRTCKSLGIPICSGGLFGLGESWADRVDLALTLLEAEAFSIPVNFLSPIPGTRLAQQPVLSRDEARRIVILLRLLLPDRQIRICGGRPTVFGPTTDNLAPMAAGADGLMVGDYLTTNGASLDADKAGLEQLGFVTPP